MSDPIYTQITIIVGSEEVILDPANLKFNEATLSDFLDSEGSWYDYFGRHLANAEAELSAAKENAEVTYMRYFVEHKDGGAGSDKKAECMARIEPAVIEARKAQLEADRNVRILKQHLRSFDHSHNNAISMGYTLRKEMEKLGTRITSSPDDFETKLRDVVGRNAYVPETGPGESE